jgi:hypothetical protein
MTRPQFALRFSTMTARRRSLRTRLAVLFLLALLGPACGGSKSTGTITPPPGSSVASVSPSTPVGVQAGQVLISYRVAEEGSLTSSLTVEYSVDGGSSFQPATGGPGGDGVSGLASSPSPGTLHTFVWNSLGDGVGLPASAAAVKIRLTPRTSLPGSPASTSNFAVDNSTHTAPSVVLTPPGGVKSGLVSVAYALVDAESDPCTIQAGVSVDGGATFIPATTGPGGDGTSLLTSSPGGGVGHVYVWNSVADGVALAGVATQVQIRLQPADGMAGPVVTSPNFSVDNTGSASGSSLGGAFPVRLNPTALSDWATAAASDGTSLITAGFLGFDFTATSGANSSWRIEKRSLASGGLVPLFGVGGAVIENPGPGLDVPFKVIVDGTSVYVLGAQETAKGSRVFNLRVEMRRVSDGSPVAPFGVGGVLLGSGVAGVDGVPFPWALAVDGSFLYLAGTAPESSTDFKWRIEKRDKLSGALVPGFGVAGAVEGNPTPGIDGCFGIVIDPTHLWLVGSQNLDGTAASDGQIRMEKRSLLDGSLAAGFGVAGVVTVNPGPGDDLAEEVVKDGSSFYVYSRVETSLSSGLFSRRLEKRNLSDGALALAPVTAAGTDPTGALPVHHLALDGNSLYVCGAEGAGNCVWRVEKRKTSDLSLVSEFGAAGVLTISPVPGGYHRPIDLLVSGGVVYLAGMDSASGNEGWRIGAHWK